MTCGIDHTALSPILFFGLLGEEHQVYLRCFPI